MNYVQLLLILANIARRSMVLEYLPTFTPKMAQFCRCAYSSTMVRIWDTGTIVQLCLLGGLEH